MKKFDNLFQIGGVAKLFNISRKMILNYENHKLIMPTLVDAQSGYRYFDSYAIARIQLILDLRKTDMSLSDIKKYFTGKLSAENQVEILKSKILAAQNAIKTLEVRITDCNATPVINEIELPERYCICKEFIAEDVDNAISAFVNCYYDCLRRGLTFADGGYHFCEFPKDIFDENFYELTNISMKICICIDKNNAPKDAVIYPKTKAISVSYCGEYEKSFISYELLKEHIKKKGYKVTGFPQEIYLQGNFNNNSNENIVWVIIPIE